jgi:hypothetical protein
VASGRAGDVDVRRIATQFSGAWPYQQLIGELSGQDALSEAVGRAYWTGSDLTRAVDAQELGRRLLNRFAGQAGHYWSHLTETLLDEVTPTHIFHVLGVYPWTRLLGTGQPEPLHVLDSCRIRVGEVIAVGPKAIEVRTDTLEFTDGALILTDVAGETVDWKLEDADFVDSRVVPGDRVAIHWGFACDLLTPDQAEQLLDLTRSQIKLTNERLRHLSD